MPEAVRLKYEGLQCLRAVAAFLVMTAHSVLLSTHFAGIGVDIFFVLSGFVIALTSEKPDCTWQHFSINRFTRVIPYYYLMTLPFALLRWRHGIANDELISSILFFPYYAPLRTIHPYGWTLSFEIWFYLAFTVLLALCRSGAALWLVLCLSVGVLLNTIYYQEHRYLVNFFFHPLVLEFCAGIVLYRCRNWLTNSRALTCTLAALLVMGYQVSIPRGLGDPGDILANNRFGLQRAILWGGFSIALVALVLSVEQMRLIKWPRWLVRLGDASFSLYLLQPLVLMLLYLATKYARLPEHAAHWLFIPLSVGISLVMYPYVEKPLTQTLKTWCTKGRGNRATQVHPARSDELVPVKNHLPEKLHDAPRS